MKDVQKLLNLIGANTQTLVITNIVSNIQSGKNVDDNIEMLINIMKTKSDRYIEAEKELLRIYNLPWYRFVLTYTWVVK